MRRTLGGHPEGARGSLKPRYRYWLKVWVLTTLLQLGVIWIYCHFAGGPSGFWKLAQTVYPFLGALGVAVTVYPERVAPPRKYSF